MSETNKQVPAVIRLLGRIDSNNAPEVEKDAMGLLTGSGASEVIIDAGDLEYISSAGLRSVLKMAKVCNSQKVAFLVCGIQPPVYEVFRISGFTSLLTIKNTRQEALDAL